MSASEETLALLKSIDASLKTLVVLAQRREQKTRAAAPKPVASDRELDSQYGDPKVTFNPRDWTGQSMKGARMSQTHPDFLELLAETLDYFADQAEAKDERTEKGKPIADFKRKDAARARGWAKRMRDRGMAAVGAAQDFTPENWSNNDSPDWGDGSFS